MVGIIQYPLTKNIKRFIKILKSTEIFLNDFNFINPNVNRRNRKNFIYSLVNRYEGN